MLGDSFNKVPTKKMKKKKKNQNNMKQIFVS